MTARIVFIVTLLCASAVGLAHPMFGSYEGRVVAEWLKGGREMRLTEPFAYIGPDGARWDAPAGTTVDGASIPRPLWAAVSSPFTGLYREASVIHDVVCVRKSAPWQKVHLAFYTAMLASGVDPIQAKVMYAGVLHLGPRWERRVVERASSFELAQSRAATISTKALNGEKSVTSIKRLPQRWDTNDAAVATVRFVPDSRTLTESEFENLRAKIVRDDLSVEQIEKYKPPN
jgi:hypothetical protein